MPDMPYPMWCTTVPGTHFVRVAVHFVERGKRLCAGCQSSQVIRLTRVVLFRVCAAAPGVKERPYFVRGCELYRVIAVYFAAVMILT